MKLIKSTYLRIKLNRGIIIKTALTIVGCVYTTWGCVSLFEPLEGDLPWKRLTLLGG